MIDITGIVDRGAGKQIDISIMKTHRETLAQYHLSPEPKFANGGFRDRGGNAAATCAVIRHIGKEDNRWEEQMILGHEPGERIEYGLRPDDEEEFPQRLRLATEKYG
jgi:hypothetical protein